MECIYAVDIKNGLSKDGKIPWHSKKDLQFFMNKTKNNVVIMGKNTYFSLPSLLKNRLNVILTRNISELKELITNKSESSTDYLITDNDKIHEFILNNREKYLQEYPFLKNDFKIFFIGGKIIYEKYIPLCKTIWVTKIKKDYLCDLILDYDYSNEFNKELVDEDKELTIIKYVKKYIALVKDGSTFKIN